MSKDYDVIIIGGGHNGLVNAAYLAKSGLKVKVLERRHLVGGSTVTEEMYPGFKYSVFSYVVSLLRPEIIRDLELTKHGLKMLPLESTLTPSNDGRGLYRGPDGHRTYRSIAQFSKRDAEAYGDYSRTMYFMARAVRYMLGIIPPDPTSWKIGDLKGFLNLSKHMLGLSKADFYMLSKLMTMSSADFLEEWFECDPLVSTLSASGIIGTNLGPRSPGTAYVLLHHYMGEVDGVARAWGFQKGGTGGVAEAIASSARALGVDIECNITVEKVKIVNGEAKGVILSDGVEMNAKTIVSGLDPKLTFLKLVDEGELPTDLTDSIKNFNTLGSSGKVNMSLDSLPNVACMPGRGEHMRGAVSISPTRDHLERAFDEAKYGNFATKPFMDTIFPSMIDPDMAPPGKHVMSCFVQYAPYELANGTWDENREAFGDAVVNTLAEYMPDIKEKILHRQVLSPWDMEKMTGLTQGNIFQGELNLSQLFFLRPHVTVAKYRTPIEGYYQCGSGTHPGGGICGAPGRLSALEILKDLKR